MTVGDWLRKLWFEALVRLPVWVPGGGTWGVGACRKFVDDPRATYSGVYCRVCGYDIEVHDVKHLVKSVPDDWAGL